MWILIAAIAALLLVMGISFASYYIAFHCSPGSTEGSRDLPDTEQYNPYKKDFLALVDEQAARPFEQVYITSGDGLKLAGKYYHVRDGAPLQILFHGYRSVADRDFCGGMKLCLQSGCNALLVDQRSHGRSGGRTLTLGIKERRDCLDWVRYAVNRFGPDVKIILCGVSMGAATVLMATELSLPENVVGITADCGYSSPKAIIQKVIRHKKLPVWLVYPFVRLGARLYGRFGLETGSAAGSLTGCKVPVLFIHGEDDRFVPCSMGRENYEACASEKYILTVPGAGHGMCYFGDMGAYEEAVRAFVVRVTR